MDKQIDPTKKDQTDNPLVPSITTSVESTMATMQTNTTTPYSLSIKSVASEYVQIGTFTITQTNKLGDTIALFTNDFPKIKMLDNFTHFVWNRKLLFKMIVSPQVVGQMAFVYCKQANLHDSLMIPTRTKHGQHPFCSQLQDLDSYEHRRVNFHDEPVDFEFEFPWLHHFNFVSKLDSTTEWQQPDCGVLAVKVIIPPSAVELVTPEATLVVYEKYDKLDFSGYQPDSTKI